MDPIIAPTRYILTNPKTICPALILAASRKDSVMGRTSILIVSIKTKAGANQLGAPEGNNPAANSVGELINDDKIRANHIGAPSANVI